MMSRNEGWERLCLVALKLDRQFDLEAGFSGFRLYADLAPVFLDDDTMADIESQTGSLALRFGGEKGVEDLALNFRRNAGAVIFDFNYNPAIFLVGAQSDFTLPFHGAHGVVDDIGPDLVELAAIGFYLGQTVGIFPSYSDAGF